MKTLPWVKDSTYGINISGDIFWSVFSFANTTGTLKISATTQAIPIPDASMVQDFRDLLSRKTTLKLFSDFPEQIDVHLMI